eukprot:403348996
MEENKSQNSKSNSNSIRKANHAGSWYTEDPDDLNTELKQYLNQSQQTVDVNEQGQMKALIGPHAGFRFSGPTAAWAYINIKNPEQYKRVFLLGPSHKVYLDNIATTACDEWETPLGNLKIDHITITELIQNGKEQELFQQISKKYEENEHSLEMHIPFIRKMFEGREDVTLVPLMVGQIPDDKFDRYAELLMPYFLDQQTLFIVSSDFCHWGKRFQFTLRYQDQDKSEPIHKSIEKLDHEGMSLIQNHDFNGFKQYLKTLKNTICGRYPIQVLLAVINKVEQTQQYKCSTKFVKYAQSSEIQMDEDDSSVSYASSYTLLQKLQ